MSYPTANRLEEMEGRGLRARRILAIVAAFTPIRIATATVLDVGASHLHIARQIAASGARVIAIDVDRSALEKGAAHGGVPVAAIAASGLALPFRDECFDLVVCNHIYEHVADPSLLLQEIRRVLRPGGYCYFSGGHKYQLIEPHFRLPLLSWLPTPIANRILQALGKGNYDIRFLTLRDIPSLFAGFASSSNITSKLLLRAEEFRIGPGWASRLLGMVPIRVVGMIGSLAPTHIWLLRK